jgi:hypothetical protein
MLEALGVVRPQLQRFYDTLNDEQKARFNAVTPELRSQRTARRETAATDLSQACSGQAIRPTDVPTERIARALNPTDAQRGALAVVDDATKKAADYLKANCARDDTLTPPGRVAAMEQRLKALLEAINMVQPALENFYKSLTDEQKARFNTLGAQQS